MKWSMDWTAERVDARTVTMRNTRTGAVETVRRDEAGRWIAQAGSTHSRAGTQRDEEVSALLDEVVTGRPTAAVIGMEGDFEFNGYVKLPVYSYGAGVIATEAAAKKLFELGVASRWGSLAEALADPESGMIRCREGIELCGWVGWVIRRGHDRRIPGARIKG